MREAEIGPIVASSPRSPLGLPGWREFSAAKDHGDAAGWSLFRSKAVFARWNGIEPGLVQSHDSLRFRLSAGGNCQIDERPPGSAITRPRSPNSGTRAYVRRRQDQGLAPRGAPVGSVRHRQEPTSRRSNPA
jgi:hypothetical protein